MSFESFDAFEESLVQPQVEEIFEDWSGKTVKERMGAAAFDLALFIGNERAATNDVLKNFLERDRETRKNERTLRKIGAAIIDGFKGLGIGISGGYETLPSVTTSQDTAVKPKKRDELSDKFKKLEQARLLLAEAKLSFGELYDLKPRQVNRAEAKARRLTMPPNHPEA